jgi:uncharacterized protein (DUF697 family)
MNTSRSRSRAAAGSTRPAAHAGSAIPVGDAQITAVVDDCRRLVNRHALVAAGVAAVPIPGIDWVTDVGVLMKLIPRINEAFGLSEEQVERLAPDRRIVVYKVLSASGGLLVGKVVTRGLVIGALKLVGVRLTAQQAAKVVPLAGQALSAVLTWSALRYVCDQHIRQCAAVARQLALPAPRGLVERVDDLPDPASATRH